MRTYSYYRGLFLESWRLDFLRLSPGAEPLAGGGKVAALTDVFVSSQSGGARKSNLYISFIPSFSIFKNGMN